MLQNILIVEDDKHISKLVKYALEKAGYTVTAVITGEDALDALDTQAADLVILDVMLPKMDGFQTCKEIRSDSKFQRLPIIMLTAKGEEVDRIVGFELGADDYIVKPFSPRELVLRVKALLKRSEERKTPMALSKEILSIGDLTIDIPRHKVTAQKKTIDLTAMEFKLLTTLMTRAGRVQSREQLLDDVWDIQADITTRTVDTHVKRLRQKLGRAGDSIQTIRGYGYKFEEEV